MSSSVQSFQEARTLAHEAIFGMRDLASAFRRVGQIEIAIELYAYVTQLERAIDTMDAAFGEELIRSVNQAREAAANMLRVALVVGGVGVVE